MIDYTPPTPDDLRRLKDDLGYTGAQMGELASVVGGQQWRKYTSATQPRPVNMHILFFMAARLALSPEALHLVGHKMREMGAKITPADLSGFEKNS